MSPNVWLTIICVAVVVVVTVACVWHEMRVWTRDDREMVWFLRTLLAGAWITASVMVGIVTTA